MQNKDPEGKNRQFDYEAVEDNKFKINFFDYVRVIFINSLTK